MLSATKTTPPRKLTAFFILTFLLSLPAYVGATLVPQEIVMFMGLIGAFAPITAALILTYGESRLEGAKKLVKRAFDYSHIAHKIWYLPMLCLMPVIFIIVLGIMRFTGQSIPVPLLPVVAGPIAFLAFVFFALLEEVGWMGYAVDPMQSRRSALHVSLVLGIIWAFWHLPFYLASGFTPIWIAGQLLALIALRTLIIWLYNNTGSSVFGIIVFHAVYNLCTLMIPTFSTAAGHFMTSILTIVTAVIVTWLWGAETCMRYRFQKDVAENISR